VSNYFLQIMDICIPNGEIKIKRNPVQSEREIPFSAQPSVLANHQICQVQKLNVTKWFKFSGQANMLSSISI